MGRGLRTTALVEQLNSKWKSVLWSDESKFDIFVGNHGCHVLRAKEEGDLPACYQSSVQKPASLMVWGCISAYSMGSLHVLEGTMNAETASHAGDPGSRPARRRRVGPITHTYIYIYIYIYSILYILNKKS